MQSKKSWNKIYRKKGTDYTSPIANAKKAEKFFEKEDIMVKKILDVGCGSGTHLKYFSDSGYDVYGVDISEDALKEAKNLLNVSNEENLKQNDVFEKLPFENDFFDAIVSFRVINHNTMDGIQNLIREMERVLKPNGLVYISVSKPRGSNEDIPNVEKVGERAFKNLEGEEKGVIHFLFNDDLIDEMFTEKAAFEIKDISVDSNGYYRLKLEANK